MDNLKSYIDKECELFNELIKMITFSFVCLLFSLSVAYSLIIIYNVLPSVYHFLWVVNATVLFVMYVFYENKPNKPNKPNKNMKYKY